MADNLSEGLNSVGDFWSTKVLGKHAPPPSPDLNQVAQTQGAADIKNTMLSGALNRPTQITPYGQQTWSLRPGADPSNPQPGDWVSTQSLSQPQQNLMETNTAVSQGLADTSLNNLTDVKSTFAHPLDTSGLPAAPTVDLPTSLQAFQGDRQRAEDALYKNQTQYYDQRFARDEASKKSELVNSGLNEGSEAYKNAMADFNQNKNQAYSTATNNAVSGGAQYQGQELGNLLSAITGQQQARNAQLTTNTALRELPLNEINILRNGTNPATPQFSASQPYGTPQTPNMVGASEQNFSNLLGSVNAQNAQGAGTRGAVLNALATYFSG